MYKSVSELANRWLRRNEEALSEVESRVLQSSVERRTIASDTNKAFANKLSPGDRIADAIARVGGSWNFIIGFLVFLIAWTILNAVLLATDAFDPYPFVFLNLLLSMIAALQAPIIMMSQNRQAARDRLDATHDYEVNLKSEIEIMALHAKIEELRSREIALLCTQITELTDMVRTGFERRDGQD